MQQQSPAPAATPAATPLPTAETAAFPKEINVTAWEGEHEVIVQYNGGKDAPDLVMFRVQIDNRDGKNVKTPIYSPEIGKQYLFRYIGVVNPNTINIVGVFRDGSEQTVLLKYF